MPYKCSCCHRIYRKKFDEDLKKQFDNTYEFSSHDINEILLLLQKGVYRSEDIDNLKKFNELSSPNKEDFYSTLNIKHITSGNFGNAKRV